MTNGEPEERDPVEDNRRGVRGDPTPDAEYGDKNYIPEMEEIADEDDVYVMQHLVISGIYVSDDEDAEESLQESCTKVTEKLEEEMENYGDVVTVEVRGRSQPITSESNES